MNQRVRINTTGGPEVMQLIQDEPQRPGPDQVLLRQYAVGLNYIDVYFRTGLYPQALPGGLGLEGAGIVEAVGDNVREFQAGDRVAYAGGPTGAYATYRLIPASVLVRLPDAIDFETAAAVMLKGLTVAYLFHRTYALKPGQTMVFHAAAGGVGLIACQWARALGVKMIGTAGSEKKVAMAREHGCWEVINYNAQNFVSRVRELTDGQGVPVVYDSVGKATFTGSLDCLAPLGLMVSFGNASGAVEDFSLLDLSKRGSLFVTRPRLFDYVASREALNALSGLLFEQLLSGGLEAQVGRRYALSDIQQAHRDLEGRELTGSAILLP
ncbi:quinone oxidoreductase family protein [Bowmanella dokdonensis]|uniref:NADPH:quinone reductase n=1 Tax=Bowmanella dokdonensis TaxID=751969 RepID=A0A939IPL9_9ALTE|nr:quinone oxidoreductase [Bowmanella dokdonensis]MBN7826020.1 quinone oxidoreductase [Bowmanella dokdonensis]